jgi:hypothetical protein
MFSTFITTMEKSQSLDSFDTSTEDSLEDLVEYQNYRSRIKQNQEQINYVREVLQRAQLLRTNLQLFGDTEELRMLMGDSDPNHFLRLADSFYCVEEDAIDDSVLGKIKNSLLELQNGFKRTFNSALLLKARLESKLKKLDTTDDLTGNIIPKDDFLRAIEVTTAQLKLLEGQWMAVAKGQVQSFLKTYPSLVKPWDGVFLKISSPNPTPIDVTIYQYKLVTPKQQPISASGYSDSDLRTVLQSTITLLSEALRIYRACVTASIIPNLARIKNITVFHQVAQIDVHSATLLNNTDANNVRLAKMLLSVK